MFICAIIYNMKKIILASSSPRRIEMMRNNGFEPQVQPANIDETLPMAMSPEAAVMFLALKKAQFVLNKLHPSDSIIIAADTVVVCDGEIIGKPVDREDALSILIKLRARPHQVITGVAIIEMDDTVPTGTNCLYDTTHVYFTDYSDKALSEYVDTDEPYDKAGGYAIQGTFKRYVDHIEGDYDNVVGFPWYRIKEFLISQQS
jgi:septum formation protein